MGCWPKIPSLSNNAISSEIWTKSIRGISSNMKNNSLTYWERSRRPPWWKNSKIISTWKESIKSWRKMRLRLLINIKNCRIWASKLKTCWDINLNPSFPMFVVKNDRWILELSIKNQLNKLFWIHFLSTI